MYTRRPLCFRCRCTIRKHDAYMEFLMPRPDGQVHKVMGHGRCIEAFNRLATTKAFSDIWQAKVRAELRREGVYVA